MEIQIQTIERGSHPPSSGTNQIYLRIDHWNDYSFVTMFDVFAFDEKGTLHELGSVKIGFKGQTTNEPTYSKVPWPVSALPSDFFSLGTDVDYYSKLGKDVSPAFKEAYCLSLRDIVFDSNILTQFSDEEVFKTSLMRTNSMSAIHGQYERVLKGEVALTDFSFKYSVDQSEEFGGYELNFKVAVGATPPTNIHALIGRNGVGKTTFLNDLILAGLGMEGARGSILSESWFSAQKISPDYFSGIISVSFSAFDPFSPPEDRPEPDEGPAYHYIGIKDASDTSGARLKSTNDLHSEFVSALQLVLSQDQSAKRWLAAIETLEIDENFREMRLARLAEGDSHLDTKGLYRLLRKMSSGHAVVILTITKLVAFVQEKTLVLVDEPESHLHPPLLSALTRSISDLLYSRNGVAIIATHSPVVLQEVPASCVWKMIRSKNKVAAKRPDIETFAENVGILTREVFGLEVDKSGFHDLLSKEVDKGKTFDDIWLEYGGQLGFEGQALLRTLVGQRDRKAG